MRARNSSGWNRYSCVPDVSITRAAITQPSCAAPSCTEPVAGTSEETRAEGVARTGRIGHPSQHGRGNRDRRVRRPTR